MSNNEKMFALFVFAFLAIAGIIGYFYEEHRKEENQRIFVEKMAEHILSSPERTDAFINSYIKSKTK